MKRVYLEDNLIGNGTAKQFAAVLRKGKFAACERLSLINNSVGDSGGSAAHVVLEWGAPWSRQTHKFYPPKVRARVVDVLLRPCALFFFHKDSRMATEMVDAFEASLVKFVVASAYWR